MYQFQYLCYACKKIFCLYAYHWKFAYCTNTNMIVHIAGYTIMSLENVTFTHRTCIGNQLQKGCAPTTVDDLGVKT